MSEQLIERYPDGHEVRRDSRQWIVKHPRTCRNARRGGGAYARFTYLTTEAGLRKELAGCQVKLSPL